MPNSISCIQSHTSGISYATSGHKPSHHKLPLSSHPVYRVHPSLHTGSHPSAGTSLHSRPSAAFLGNSVQPAQTQQTPYPTLRRMTLNSKAINAPEPTTRGFKMDERQLKPDHVFVYERPSKASYYEPDSNYGRQPSITPPKTMSSQATQHHAQNQYPISPRRTQSRSNSPLLTSNQRSFPPPVAMDQPALVTYPQIRKDRPGEPAAVQTSTPLLRQETDMSSYSQITFQESYAAAMHRQGQQERSKSLDIQELQQRPKARPLSTASTCMSLTTAQDLWKDLYQTLLTEENNEGQRELYRNTREPDIIFDRYRTNGAHSKVTDYDHTWSPTSSVLSPSPIPIVRLKSNKAPKMTGSARPHLRRRSSSTFQYKGHEMQADAALQKSHVALDMSNPKKYPPLAPESVPTLQQIPLRRSSRQALLHTSYPDPIHTSLNTLTNALRAKTSRAEVLEKHAMRELQRQSAPSEADTEDRDIEDGNNFENTGSASGGSKSSAEMDDEDLEPVNEHEANESQCMAWTPELPSKTSTSDPNLTAGLSPLRRCTKIPAPISRPLMGKLYKARSNGNKI